MTLHISEDEVRSLLTMPMAIDAVEEISRKQASGEVVEKWAGRVIPLASSLIGAALNYYFVRAWGKRAQAHFRQKHLEMRRKFATGESGLPLTGSSQHLLS